MVTLARPQFQNRSHADRCSAVATHRQVRKSLVAIIIMKRIALIIGNSTYPDSPLKNPVNDAIAVQERLTRLGFKALKRTDETNKRMEEG